jgi:alkylated DNA repair dioxygenase AlkB
MTIPQQPGLFDAQEDPITATTAPRRIPGLLYVPEFIDQVTHDQVLLDVDAAPWLGDLKRRVQHYGYKYDYTARRVNHSMRLGPLPDWALRLAARLVQRGLLPEMPDQLIVNEYQPGQGIANHIDCVPCFTDTIASLSLGSSCVMNFKNAATKESVPVLLDPRSVVVMNGEARYAWTHGIAARKTDEYQGRTIQRRRRVSLTFRTVILENQPHPAADTAGPSMAPE